MRSMIHKITGPALLTLLGIAIAATPAMAADVPGENALPSSTLAVVKISDTGELRDAIGQSQFGALLNDPAMEPLKQDISAKLEDFNAEMKQRLGVTLEELIKTPDGPAWLAVTRQEKEIPVAVLLVADAGQNADQMNQILTRGTEQLEQQDGKVSTETFQGKTLHVIQPPAEENPPLVWTNDENVYYVSVGLDAMKDLLANAGGRADSLASNAGFQAISEKLSTQDAQISWFIDINQILNLVVEAAAAQGGNAGQTQQLLQAIGLQQLKAVGGTVNFAQGEYDMLAKTFIYAPGEKTGLLRLAQFPAIEAQPEPWVPASVSSYATYSWDIDAAYTAAQDLVNMFLPGALENIEKGLQGPQGETIRFQQDIIGPVGDRITVLSDFKDRDNDELDAEDQRALFAIALEDAQTFQNTLNKVLAITGITAKKREFQGATIYDFELPELPAAPGTPQVQLQGTVNATIAKDHFIVTGDTTLLEQILRDGGTPLADDQEFQAVAAKYPNQVSSFTFNRPDEQARALYNLVKSGQFQEALKTASEAGGAQMPALTEVIDVSKIPEFATFAQYLTNGGSYTEMGDDGLTITQFALPKGSNQ